MDRGQTGDRPLRQLKRVKKGRKHGDVEVGHNRPVTRPSPDSPTLASRMGERDVPKRLDTLTSSRISPGRKTIVRISWRNVS